MYLFWILFIQGYDMEDAMILNKSSHERGFGHGCVYKSEVNISFRTVNLTLYSKIH